MDILYSAVSSNTQKVYDEDVRNMLESHLDYLRSHKNTTNVELPPSVVYAFKGDFYGLLQYGNVPPTLWFITLRMNNLNSPNDFDETKTSYLVPDIGVINTLINIFNTR